MSVAASPPPFPPASLLPLLLLVDVDAGHACSPFNPDSHQLDPTLDGIGWPTPHHSGSTLNPLKSVEQKTFWREIFGSGSSLLCNPSQSILDPGFDEWLPRRKWPLCFPRFCFRLWEGGAGQDAGSLQASLLGASHPGSGLLCSASLLCVTLLSSRIVHNATVNFWQLECSIFTRPYILISFS